MKKKAFYAAAIVLVTFLSPKLATADPVEIRNAVGKGASWLFIQTADSLLFDGKAIRLAGVNPAVVMFTDRPHRVAESMPVAAFVGAWTTGGAKSFRADPPNAGLTTFVDGKFKLATVELSTPRLDGTTVTYAVRILSGTVPPAGGETSLFIDGGCNWGDTSGC